MTKKTKIIDISMFISESTIVYPKNPKTKLKEINTGHSYLTEVTIGTHTGTHIDVPRHVFKNKWGIDKLDLHQVMGTCRVLDMTDMENYVKIDDLKKAKIKKGEKILVKTKNSLRGFKKFYDDYIYLDGDAADFLAKKKIDLFGIDYLSVKQRGSTDQRPHTSLLEQGIVIVEGLNLSQAKEGTYFFIGLPLKFGAIDGSPVRAVLIEN